MANVCSLVLVVSFLYTHGYGHAGHVEDDLHLPHLIATKDEKRDEKRGFERSKWSTVDSFVGVEVSKKKTFFLLLFLSQFFSAVTARFNGKKDSKSERVSHDVSGDLERRKGRVSTAHKQQQPKP